MIEEIFTTLGFKEEETQVYLALLDHGACSGGQLAKAMHMPRPTIYGYLEKLAQAGLVNQTQERGVKIFVAAPPDKIRQLFRRKMSVLQSKEKILESVIPALELRVGSNFVRPKMIMLDGPSAIQNAMEDMLSHPDVTTYTIWPIKAMLGAVGEDYLYYHNLVRVKRNIQIHGLWQRDQALAIVNEPSLGTGKYYCRTIRMAPPDMKFQMGVWFYKNKAIYISSQAESFGFVIESDEMIDLLFALHQTIWAISEPLDITPKGAEAFYQEAMAI